LQNAQEHVVMGTTQKHRS